MTALTGLVRIKQSLVLAAFLVAALACSPLDGPLGNGPGTGTITVTPGGPVPGVFSGANIPRATAEAFIRKHVKNVSPVLLPVFVPDTFVQDVIGSYDNFSITYGVQQTWVTLKTGSSPGSGAFKHLKFRSDPTAVFIAHYSQANWTVLSWKEPGRSIVKTCQCVEYTLLAQGLSEADFFKVANSLT